MQKTYSRKGVNRRHRLPEHTAPEASDSDSEPPGPPAKRQKLTAQLGKSSKSKSRAQDVASSSRNDTGGRKTPASKDHGRERNEVTSPGLDIVEPEYAVASTSRNTKGTRSEDTRPSRAPLARSDILPNPAALQRQGSPSPTKGARDLSNLFNFTFAYDDPSISPAKPSTSVAKRMLRRTATDSSTSSRGGSFASVDSYEKMRPTPRTPTKLTKTRSDSIIDLTLGSPSSRVLSPQKSQSLDDISSPPQPTRPAIATTNMRTYTGKSRSFLVALPAAQFGVGGLSRANSSAADQDDSGVFVGSQEDDLEIEESYTDRRIRWGVDNSEDDPRPWSPPPESASPNKRKGKGKQVETPRIALPNGMMNDLKSITELRSKGESRRFLDEVGYLFEGLEPSSAMSVRRASALDIVTKLCEPDFARKAKAADFLEGTWHVLREAGAGNGDKVMDTILAFYAALVSRDTRDLTDLVGRSDFLPTMFNMLDGLERANDPLWLMAYGLSDAELRRAGIQRVDKTLLAGLEKLARKKSGLFEPGETISNRVLISTALAALPSSYQDTAHISSLLRAIHHEFAPLPSRLSIYESGLPILSAPSSSSSLDAPSFGHADKCLRLLDSYLLGRWTSNDLSQGSDSDARIDPNREDGLAPGIISLCSVCEVVGRDPGQKHHSVEAYRCMDSALRVLISLTNDDYQWCQAVFNDQFALLVTRLIVQSQQRHQESGNRPLKQEQGIEDHVDDMVADGEQTATSLDRQCLALGLLTNLAQVSHAAKDTLRTARLSFRCAGRRACTTACHCSSRISALSCLALVYSQYDKSEAEDGVESMLRGHMAVLFGLLMRNCPENQRVLLDTLPGLSNIKNLEKLAEHARDFTNFYVDFTRRVSQVIQSQSQSQAVDLDDEAQMEDLGGFALSEDDRASKMLSDSHGAAVANDMVSFLDSLIRTEA